MTMLQTLTRRGLESASVLFSLLMCFFVFFAFSYNVVSAQEAAAAESGGNPNVGPHEAGNLPNIADKVSGLPMVIILRAGESGSWKSTFDAYGSAAPRVVRITGVTSATSVAEATATGQAIAGMGLPAGTIVVYGNELNNLDLEWKSRSVPAAGTTGLDGEVRAAASQYAKLFAAFAPAVSAAGLKPAVATVDEYNGIYNWKPWVETVKAAGGYSLAGAVVANVYEIPEILTTQAAVDQLAAAVGRPVDFLTEFGGDPRGTVKAYLDYLNSSSTPNGLQAATLVPNRCGDKAVEDGDPWLYYVRGKLYDVKGKLIEVSEGNNCSGAGTDSENAKRKPVLIYPKTIPDLDKYFANTAAYCGPKSIHYPVIDGDMPPLNPCASTHEKVISLENDGDLDYRINVEDRVCAEDEYPIIHSTDTFSLNGLSFPLLRDQNLGISIEADLSRVKPGETIFDAMRRLQRADAAPQFYLSSPETQCLNTVRYIKYVENVCEKSGLGAEECGQNLSFELNGEKKLRLLDPEVSKTLPDESICQNFSTRAQKDPKLQQMVASIEPHTPKVYKIGFLVQHHWFHQDTFLAGSFYLKQWFASWLTSTRFPPKNGAPPAGKEFPGEKLDIFPIWYAAGLAVNEYDQYQTEQPYTFNPEDIEIDEETSLPVVEDIMKANNFVSGLTRTYQAALPIHMIEDMTKERLLRVWMNNDLMKQILEQLGNPEYVLQDNRPGKDGKRMYFGHGILECWAGQCLCFPKKDNSANRLDVFGIGDDMSIEAQCPNQTVDEIAKAFPEGFTPDEAYVKRLKELIVARVNSGINKSQPYPYEGSEVVPGAQFGPMPARTFSQCAPDLYDIQFGEGEEEYTTLAAKAIQEGVVAAVTSTRTDFLTKFVVNGPDNKLHDSWKTSRTYLILPEEASNIEITQAYVAPMFFSPQMYESIVSGENPMYPFLEKIEELRKELLPKVIATYTGCAGVPWCPFPGADPQVILDKLGFDPEKYDLSALLRTKEYDRSLEPRKDGYAVYKVEKYTCGVEWIGEDDCNIKECNLDDWWYHREIGKQVKTWVPVYDKPEPQSPTCENPVRLDVTQEAKSLVDIWTHQESAGERPNPNPQTPGKLAAVNEFFRRMAFTPKHMQLWEKYPGLEEFYTVNKTAPEASESGKMIAAAEMCVDGREMPLGDLNSMSAVDSYICSIASDGQVGTLVKSVFMHEGGKARDAVLAGADSYECQINRVGATGPMQILVDACSESCKDGSGKNCDQVSKGDYCTLEDSFSAASQKISANLNETRGYVESAARQGVSIANKEELAIRLAISYYLGNFDRASQAAQFGPGKKMSISAAKARELITSGGTGCGDLYKPSDGSAAKVTGSDWDFCQFIYDQYEENAGMCN